MKADMKAVSKQVLQDINAYLKEYKISAWALLDKLNIAQSGYHRWSHGASMAPQIVQRFVDAGVTKARLPERIARANAQKRAVTNILVNIDKGNAPKRPYRTRVDVPVLVMNEVRTIIDTLERELKAPHTYDEFQAFYDNAIRRIYYVCRHDL